MLLCPGVTSALQRPVAGSLSCLCAQHIQRTGVTVINICYRKELRRFEGVIARLRASLMPFSATCQVRAVIIRHLDRSSQRSFDA
jgi:hypothetical protein